MKSILIENETHEKLKEVSEKSGIKIKYLVEESIEHYIRYHIIVNQREKK
jgi:predicted DNA-binding protein